ncbi:thioesterase II family protein [Dactylosporangium sp. NPDC048998]|uniref:thioesterase II family protein n=1 Tax=Dactylosporangium sp. NPDC048998 TaxID=3363976 RepID=UPI003721E30A
MSAVSTRWLARPAAVDAPRLRLICVPHVGAGGAAFNSWLGRMPDGVELCAVRLPGRENRLAEPLLEDWQEMLAALQPAVAPLLDVPYVLFGHCSGSVIAYELARRLSAAGTPPRTLVVTSTDGPSLRRIDDPLHLLPQRELIDRVIGYGGMAKGVLDDPDLMDMFARILRADYRLVENLVYSDGPPLDVPIVAIGGRRDRFVPVAALSAWSAATTTDFVLHLLDGGHYILAEAAGPVAAVLRDLLERRT